jgi:hypothetical protein
MLKKSINSAITVCNSRKRELNLGGVEKEVFSNMYGLCGASDYGPFSAYSPSFCPDGIVNCKFFCAIERGSHV